MYVLCGMSDTEIADTVGLSVNWVNKLRRFYGIKTDSRYQLRRNPLRHLSLSERQKEFLYGSLLGDSCIAVQKSGTGYWSCRHSLSQEGYLLIESELVSCLSHKIPFRYRSRDNQQPSLDGNVLEGSTTGGSLRSSEYGDNTRLEKAISLGTPGTGFISSGDTV